FPHSQQCLVLIGKNIDAVNSRLHQGQRGIGSIDLVYLAWKKVSNRKTSDALINPELNGASINGTQGDTRLRTHANKSVTYVQFSPRVLVCPDADRGLQRLIKRGRSPVVAFAGRYRHLPRHVLHASNSSRPVIRVASGLSN